VTGIERREYSADSLPIGHVHRRLSPRDFNRGWAQIQPSRITFLELMSIFGTVHGVQWLARNCRARDRIDTEFQAISLDKKVTDV